VVKEYMITNIIAIDGPAASGKGTIAKRLAAVLGYAHMDTGALYRLVGTRILDAGDDPSNEAGALRAAKWLRDHSTPEMCDNPNIRTAEAGNAASKCSVFPSVREQLDYLQTHFANNPPAPATGAVLDGRDIGTVICPNAPVKLFITADVEVRAKRRFDELISKGHNVTYAQIHSEMSERDQRDSTRATAPLKPAKDAVVIDTSDLSADEAFEIVKKIILN